MPEGRLLLVGIGPGAAEHMSIAARAAIEAAEVVVGYNRYLDLIADLLPGKQVIAKAMTQERDRCQVAVEQALAGRVVALVSSGDIGVYAMAGLSYELLLQHDWTPGRGIRVEVVPGITALSACAALAGAPIGHDFCAISLSDLLTPWPVIARRLEAAGRGDFVIALYNPRSGRRQGQLAEARRILLRERRPETPVAIVCSAYRPGQSVEITTLAALPEGEIGMLTTILIGNASTSVRAGLMLTPRGYARKYDQATGAIRGREQAGRPLTLGLDGWKAAVRRYLRRTPIASPADAARLFDIRIGAVLDAVAAGAPGDAGDHLAVPIRVGAQRALLGVLADWGRVRIRGGSGTSPSWELALDAALLELAGERLRSRGAPCEASIDCAPIWRGWFVDAGAHSRSLQFVDALGSGLFEIALGGGDAAVDRAALAAYGRARRDFADSEHA